MIPIQEVLDSLHYARIAYIVTIGQENDIMAVIIGGNKEGIEPTPETEVIHALDAVLAGEQDNPECPQVLSNFIGLYDFDEEIILN